MPLKIETPLKPWARVSFPGEGRVHILSTYTAYSEARHAQLAYGGTIMRRVRDADNRPFLTTEF